jgi:hypothetical protein
MLGISVTSKLQHSCVRQQRGDTVETLYKQAEGILLYWQAWHYMKLVSTVSGRVGAGPKLVTHHAADESTAAAEVEAAASAKRLEGYAEIPMLDYHQVVIQWRRDTWASVPDLKWRDEVEAVMDEALGAKGLGVCDGGTFGGHKVQVFCMVVDPDLGVRKIIAGLQEVERLEGAVVATREGEKYRVVFPEGYQGGFSIL